MMEQCFSTFCENVNIERDMIMHNPNFSSGPCSKRPQWSLDALKDSAVGRSHRSALGKEKLAKAISESKRIRPVELPRLLVPLRTAAAPFLDGDEALVLGPRPVT